MLTITCLLYLAPVDDRRRRARKEEPLDIGDLEPVAEDSRAGPMSHELTITDPTGHGTFGAVDGDAKRLLDPVERSSTRNRGFMDAVELQGASKDPVRPDGIQDKRAIEEPEPDADTELVEDAPDCIDEGALY